MKTSAVTVDMTVYRVTIVVLQQLIAPQLCKESTASKENYMYVELNVVLHQKSKRCLVLSLRGVLNKTKTLN